MDVKFLLVLLGVLFAINATSARPRRVSRRSSCSCPRESRPCPPKLAYFYNIATPFPACIETIDYIPNVRKPCCNDCGNDQLILPPLQAELPYGLGYFPSALPLVAKSFAPALDFLPTGAYLPVASPCDCLTLAAPVPPEYAPLVKPIIL